MRPDRLREPVLELGTRLLADLRPRVAVGDVQRPHADGGLVDVGGDAPGGGAPLLGELAEQVAQFPDALPGERGQREDGGPGLAVLAERDAVLVQQPPQVVQDEVDGLAGQPVHLVQDDERHLGVPGQRAQVPLVQHRVGVLLRVHHPHHRVDQGEHPVHVLAVGAHRGVQVRQVHQDQPAQRLGLGGLARPAPQPPGDLQPVQQPGRAVGPAARDGRGRRRPAQPRLGDLHSGK